MKRALCALAAGLLCCACAVPGPKTAAAGTSGSRAAESGPAARPSAQIPSPVPSDAAPTEAVSERGGPVLIRLRNACDTLELRSVFAVFPGDTVVFGDIPARGESAYHPVARAYRYAYIRATAGGKEWALQPADYVGEKLLEPGRYTWSIKPHEGPYPGFLDFDPVRDP